MKSKKKKRRKILKLIERSCIKFVKMSSDSENEDLTKFAEAVDSSLFDNTFYNGEDKKAAEKDQKKEEKPKSLRYLEEDEIMLQSEINVSDNMKSFIGNKMSAIIDNSLEFVELEENSKLKKKVEKLRDEDGVQLLKGFPKVTKLEEKFDDIVPPKKFKVKRKIVENDDLDEKTKIKQSIIDLQEISHETSNWRKRTKNLKEFVTYGDLAHLKEEENEYTVLRKKNNWHESKISKVKHPGRSLNKINR
jgi:hypothetical protein